MAVFSMCIKPTLPNNSTMYVRLATNCVWNSEPSKWGVLARFMPTGLRRAIVFEDVDG